VSRSGWVILVAFPRGIVFESTATVWINEAAASIWAAVSRTIPDGGEL
jgi:hypothetical protein